MMLIIIPVKFYFAGIKIKFTFDMDLIPSLCFSNRHIPTHRGNPTQRKITTASLC